MKNIKKKLILYQSFIQDFKNKKSSTVISLKENLKNIKHTVSTN